MPARYLPVDARGWRLAMGLRPLEASQWLECDEDRAHDLALKRSLLRAHRDAVVATLETGVAASDELLEAVREWFATYAPDVALDELDDHPIVAAASLVQEDLCVLERSDAWRLSSACVCFPSRWDLTQKIGTTLDDIHAPIPGYREHLAAPTTAVFDRLKPERSFWRLNWTLLDQADLYQPAHPRRQSADDFEHWFFRVERQTIRRLARSGAVVFTIRTYVHSLAELAQRRDFLEHLAAAIEQAPPEMQHYKGWLGVADQLRATFGV